MESSQTYIEFKLSVPIWDISDEETGDTAEIKSLFAVLAVTQPDVPLARLYHSFYDYSAARYQGDPCARTGRGDVFVFLSDVDPECFIAFDMFNEATDQMNAVVVQVRAPDEAADKVKSILETIRASAEVASALLQGELGIKQSLAVENFPRRISNHGTSAIQQVQIFRGGRLAER